MEYKCTLIPIKQLTISHSGIVMPICDECETQDCSNPIERKKISIMGVIKEVRVFSKGTEEHFVVDCIGFSK